MPGVPLTRQSVVIQTQDPISSTPINNHFIQSQSFSIPSNPPSLQTIPTIASVNHSNPSSSSLAVASASLSDVTVFADALTSLSPYPKKRRMVC